MGQCTSCKKIAKGTDALKDSKSNATTRRPEHRSTSCLPGPTGSGDGQASPRAQSAPGGLGKCQRAGIARLARAGTRLADVVRGGRWTIVNTKRCVDQTRTRMAAGRGTGIGLDDGFLAD